MPICRLQFLDIYLVQKEAVPLYCVHAFRPVRGGRVLLPIAAAYTTQRQAIFSSPPQCSANRIIYIPLHHPEEPIPPSLPLLPKTQQKKATEWLHIIITSFPLSPKRPPQKHAEPSPVADPSTAQKNHSSCPPHPQHYQTRQIRHPF